MEWLWRLLLRKRIVNLLSKRPSKTGRLAEPSLLRLLLETGLLWHKAWLLRLESCLLKLHLRLLEGLLHR